MEYAKVILPAVSDWKELFRKELVKCLKWLDSDEMAEFCSWSNDMFAEVHPEILGEVFADVTYQQNYKGILIHMSNPTHQPMKKTA